MGKDWEKVANGLQQQVKVLRQQNRKLKEQLKMDIWNGFDYQVAVESGNRFSSIRIYEPTREYGQMFPYNEEHHNELLAVSSPTGEYGDAIDAIDEWVESHYLGKRGSKC